MLVGESLRTDTLVPHGPTLCQLRCKRKDKRGTTCPSGIKRTDKWKDESLCLGPNLEESGRWGCPSQSGGCSGKVGQFLYLKDEYKF